MREVKITYTCDKCGAEITDVAYLLTCYAADIRDDVWGGPSTEVAAQNLRQNMDSEVKHLCRACKDAITDGVFVL